MDIECVPAFWLLHIELLWTFLSTFLTEPVFNISEYISLSGTVRSYENCMFNMLRNCSQFPQGLHHLTFPPAMYWGSSNPVGCSWMEKALKGCMSNIQSGSEVNMTCSCADHGAWRRKQCQGWCLVSGWRVVPFAEVHVLRRTMFMHRPWVQFRAH